MEKQLPNEINVAYYLLELKQARIVHACDEKIGLSFPMRSKRKRSEDGCVGNADLQ